MLVGSDDRGGYFRPAQQLAMIAGYEIGPDFRGHLPGALRVLLGDADPIDVPMPRRHLASKQPDASCTDDGQADALWLLPHFRLRNRSLTCAAPVLPTLQSRERLGSAIKSFSRPVERVPCPIAVPWHAYAGLHMKVRWRICLLAVFDVGDVIRRSQPDADGAPADRPVEFHLSPTVLGVVINAFFVGYASMQIPGGILADKFGARKTMTAGVTLWSIFSVLTGAATSLTNLIWVRVLFGLAEGIHPPAAFKALSSWFNPASKEGEPADCRSCRRRYGWPHDRAHHFRRADGSVRLAHCLSSLYLSQDF